MSDEPIAGLLDRLAREAREQRETLLAEAREEAGRICAEAATAAERVRAEKLGRHEAELRSALARLLEDVQREGRRAALEARHAAVERVLDRVAAGLGCAVTDPRYLATARGELAEAVRTVDGSLARLRVAPALAALAREYHSAALEVEVDRDLDGFLLETRDRRVTVSGRLEERFRRLRPRLAIAASDALGEAAGP